MSKPVYNLTRADFDKMKFLIIDGVEHDLCLLNHDIDSLWDNFESIVKDSIDHSVPKKNVSKFKSLPWMTKEIRKMCTRKKLLYKRAKSCNSDVAWQQFKECSNKVKALIRKSNNKTYLECSNACNAASRHCTTKQNNNYTQNYYRPIKT